MEVNKGKGQRSQTAINLMARDPHFARRAEDASWLLCPAVYTVNMARQELKNKRIGQPKGRILTAGANPYISLSVVLDLHLHDQFFLSSV